MMALLGTFLELMWRRNFGRWPSRLIEKSSREVAAWAAIAFAIPTASTLQTKKAFTQPLDEIASTMPKKALPTRSSGKGS